MRIIIDPGHGGKDPGGGSNKYFKEKDMVLKMALALEEKFKLNNIDVVMTRYKDEYLDKNQRIRRVRESEADICLSLHINSAVNKDAKGAETIHSIYSDGKLANFILDELVKEGATKRRVFCKASTSNPKLDYYYMHRETGKVQTVIIEYGFASNEEDTQKILRDWRKYVDATFRATCQYLGIELANESYTPLVGPSEATLQQMQQWARSREATHRFIEAAEIYMKYGKLTGIRPDILYCQAAKETNFGKYTGAVKEEMNNFAGIKIKNPIGDRTEDHESFPTMDDGVRAHFNHMAAYVGVQPVGQPHDRYYVVKSLDWAGTIKYVEQLGGKWAPNPDYGKSIVRDYLKDLLNTKVETIGYKKLYEAARKENEVLKQKINELRDRLSQIKHIAEV